MRDGADDLSELRDSVRQRRGTGLEDVAALDFVELIFANGRHVAPAGSREDLFALRFSAAPAGDHELGISARDLFRAEDSSLRALLGPRFGADVDAAAELDELRAPADSGDQRFVPL